MSLQEETFVQPYNGYNIYKLNEYGLEYWIVTDEVVLILKALTTHIDLITIYSLFDPKIEE